MTSYYFGTIIVNLAQSVFEGSFETGRIAVMKGSRRVLVKVVLFQLRGRSQPQNDAMANFFAKSKCPILGLSN